MPLPSLEKITPIFDITIPSSGETLKFRPFLVKEEKILLMALEGEDERAMLDAICQVVTQCAISPVRVESFSVFDLEYIFLKLRSRSVGEVVDLSYRCQNEVELTPEQAQKRTKRGRQRPQAGPTELPTESVTTTCDNIVKLNVRLDEVQVQRVPNHDRVIHLNDSMGLTMKYPNVDMAKRIARKPEIKETVADAIEGIAMCVESVFDEASVYSSFTIKEITEWLEKLTQAQFSKIQGFFDTMPKLAHDIQFHCEQCGHTEMIHLEGLPAFFA